MRERERSRHGTTSSFIVLDLHKFSFDTHTPIYAICFCEWIFVVASSGRILHRMVIVGGRFLNLRHILLWIIFLVRWQCPCQIQKWCDGAIKWPSSFHGKCSSNWVLSHSQIYCKNHNFFCVFFFLCFVFFFFLSCSLCSSQILTRFHVIFAAD